MHTINDDDQEPDQKIMYQAHFWSMSIEALAHYAFTSDIKKYEWYRNAVWEFLRGEVE